MAEKKYIEVNALFKTVESYASTHPVMSDNELFALFCSVPAADVPSALWTDEPISGTEFMTHNQGQSGFEIHFRTDDKAKYEAVQDECRRQIDHAKPAADVRPVVRGKWHSRFYYRESTESYDCEMHVCSECGSEWSYDAETGSSDFNYCPNCGAKMEEI